jgi:hypothetical protein
MDSVVDVSFGFTSNLAPQGHVLAKTQEKQMPPSSHGLKASSFKPQDQTVLRLWRLAFLGLEK